MKLPKILLLLIFSLLAAGLITSRADAQAQGKKGAAQEQTQGQVPARQIPPGSPKITVTGKIAYLDAEGGYYIQGEKPREVFIIANQNPTVLGKLVQSGKTVTIEAKTAGDILTIETIDGQKYHGTKTPVFK